MKKITVVDREDVTGQNKGRLRATSDDGKRKGPPACHLPTPSVVLKIRLPSGSAAITHTEYS